MAAPLIASGFSRFPRVFPPKNQISSVYRYSLEKTFIRINFSFVSSGSGFWRAASTTLAICPIAPAFLAKEKKKNHPETLIVPPIIS